MARRRLRDLVMVLALLSHLFAVSGLPLPAAAPHKGTSAAYPCQERPCGCSTAEECWQGDCCCYTLEEKLTWAESRGIDAPAHVRPLVASRRARGDTDSASSCCAGTKNCSLKEPANTPPACCAPRTEVRWVLSVFAQKCRGATSQVGLLALETSLVPAAPSVWLLDARPVGSVIEIHTPSFSLAPCPPLKPPRCS